MSINSQLQEKAEKLLANDQELEIHDQRLDKLKDYLNGNEQYEIAKIWKTTPLSINSETGLENRFDAIAVLHSSVSSRDLASTIQEDLSDLSTSSIINKGVTVEIDGTPIHVTPTKFAQQGTIGLDREDYLEFSDIIGEDEMFRQASVLLQEWQHNKGLDPETQALLPFEIELTLAHIFNEYEPETLEETIKIFFEYGKASRFATQLNIFDKHDNILLYHNFMIPEKQYFLEALFDAYDQWVKGKPDISVLQ